MSMRPCERCLENNWSFKKIEDIVQATCNLCGYEVEFAARAKEKMSLGSRCRKCHKANVVLRAAKKLRTYRAYYYCPNCRACYFDPEFLVNENTDQRLNPSLL